MQADNVDWFGANVGSRLSLFCIHQMSWVNSGNGCAMMTINIARRLLLFLLLNHKSSLWWSLSKTVEPRSLPKFNCPFSDPSDDDWPSLYQKVSSTITGKETLFHTIQLRCSLSVNNHNIAIFFSP